MCASIDVVQIFLKIYCSNFSFKDLPLNSRPLYLAKHTNIRAHFYWKIYGKIVLPRY